MSDPRLAVVVYHYVRDLPRTRFPEIKGLLPSEFRAQVEALAETHEMATLESALMFLDGRYRPARDLCLLTFDDGLKEHYTEVLPILDERRLQGTFFVSTACPGGTIAAVHKNHFLMAALGLERYREEFLRALAEVAPGVDVVVAPAVAKSVYRLDTDEAAAFKYLLNFKLAATVRDSVLARLFAGHLGDERAFAGELYLSWEETKEMQRAGMVVGGHTHTHPALSQLPPDRQRADLETCVEVLKAELLPQTVWPFSYPYGAFSADTAAIVQSLCFGCAFTLEVGRNAVGQNRFLLKRIDTRDLPC